MICLRHSSSRFAEFERWKIKVQTMIITADSWAASLKAYTFFLRLRYSSRDIVRVRAFNQHNEKAKQLHEMYLGESRLSLLAIIHIKYDMLDLDEVVNLFESLHTRMMQLTTPESTITHRNTVCWSLQNFA